MAARRLPLVCLAWLLCACPPPPRQWTPVSHGGEGQRLTEVGELMLRVVAVNEGYKTLRSVQRVTLQIAGRGRRSEKRFLRAVVAVKRPDRFRLNVLGPAGVKLIDLLYIGGRYQVLHLQQRLRRSSRMPEILESLCGDLRAIYRLDPLPKLERITLEESVASTSGRTPLFDLKGYRGTDLVQTLTVFASTLAISRVEELHPDGEIRTVTFGDYQSDGKLMMPWSMHVARDGHLSYWLLIQVQELDLDVPLDERLFSPASDAARGAP
jgi:hypothetical protein